ncbi:hypothetical protein [Shouchella lonarensis]|uniref:Prophage pi2 protein 40 n=1 Tax=Shouchella lonarensis TaxID=1464122 RepID=A0A1G6III3_9BACI|nr:hypothetical protein [Shouchella lonarensis]SDC06264.1 hypothetical protein SAMN05421737_10575 [Shouchella lonarensis]
MEKTLEIDGRKVRFKSTAATTLRYKKQFGREYFADLLKMYPLVKLQEQGKDIQNMEYEVMKYIDFEVLYNITWVLAKTADKSLSEPVEWLDTFDEFPLMEILPELQELIEKSVGTKKK